MSQAYGTTPDLSATYIGLVNGDTAASLSSPAVLATTATSTSLPGTYPITVSDAVSGDYSITFVGGMYSVLKSTTSASIEGPILRAATTSPVTFTVDVSPSSEGSVPMTGNVLFYDGTRVFGVAPVVNDKAVLTTTALAQGNHMIFAVYQGDNNYAQAVTGTITQMIFSTTPATQAKRAVPVAARSRKPTPKPKPKPRIPPKPKPHPVARARVASVARPHLAAVSRSPVTGAVAREEARK